MDEEEAKKPVPPRRGIDWRALVPSVLLLAVASHQLLRAHSTDLDPWKGGGFGMFSTTDGTPIRHTHIFLTTPGEELELDLPEELEDDESRIRTLPSDAALRSFAQALSDTAREEHPDHRSVRVEVWKNRYDRETLEVRAEVLRVIEVEVDAPSAP